MTTLTRRFPLPEFNSLRREMDRLFNDFQFDRANETDSLVWMPRADLTEIEDSFVLSVDLPGIAPDDVDVTLEDDTLTISGKRDSTRELSEGRVHRIERSYGRFLRTVRFSVPVDANGIDATFDNGVLTVTIPKAESSKPKRIEVRQQTRAEITSGDGSATDESSVDVEMSESAS